MKPNTELSNVVSLVYLNYPETNKINSLQKQKRVSSLRKLPIVHIKMVGCGGKTSKSFQELDLPNVTCKHYRIRKQVEICHTSPTKLIISSTQFLNMLCLFRRNMKPVATYKFNTGSGQGYGGFHKGVDMGGNKGKNGSKSVWRDVEIICDIGTHRNASQLDNECGEGQGCSCPPP